LARYTENCRALISGMRALGFKSFLPDALQAPIIVTFHAPPDPKYDFAEFYRRVRERGFILYPGKLTTVETFRVGCIGAIGPGILRDAVAAIGGALHDMGVSRHG
jgi:2-aminoethylphosphonate-pyruvate transaminase